MSDGLQVRQFALDEFDQRYAGLRLQATAEVRQAMRQSLRRYGQLSPLVVWSAEGALVLIDGFKRLEAARQVPGLEMLGARLIEADQQTAKAAMALLDRLVDGAIIHKFQGKSYRAHRAKPSLRPPPPDKNSKKGK